MKTKILQITLLTMMVCGFTQNIYAQGGTLPLNSSVNGNIGSATPDVYTVTTTSDGLLRLTLSTTSPTDLYVQLFDNDGTTPVSASAESYSNSTVTVVVDGLAPGTYKAIITPFSTAYGAYTLSDSLFTTPLANDVEPNGSAASAVVLPQNGSKTGHVGYYYNHLRDTTDWYKVTTTADGMLRVYLSTDSGSVHSTTSTNPLDVNMYLYDNDGTTQLGAVEVFNGNKGASNLITADGLAPGTYYIKIQPYSTAEFANYTLSDTLFNATLANDAEPNGTRATAVTLSLNSTKTGHVGYYYNHVRDTTDWYKVTTTADGLLRVYLSTDSGSIYSTTSTNPLDVNMYLYDNDGTTQLGAIEVFNGNKGASNLITADGLAPGTYYIKIQPYSTAEFANYTLSDSLFLPKYPTDAEYNGTPATAITLPINSNNIKGHVGYYYNNQRDTADYYKVTTTSTGMLRIILSTLRGSVYSNNALDFNIFLYSSDGTTQIGYKEVFSGNNPTTDSLALSSLAAGTYYVKIQPYSTAEFGDYSLNVLNAAGSLLPVTFLNFDGLLVDNKANLTWSTATELNNTGFQVQKSSDGQGFSTIGFVKGAGNSSLIQTYNYTDIKVLSGYNYYRLKQVDIDGNFNYSSTIRLDFKNFDWAIFGNPISSNSWIQLQVAKTSKVAFAIYTIDGKPVKIIDKGTLSTGTYSIPLDLGNIPAGIYIVKLVSDKQTFTKKVIK
ncbi:MAG: T9SS type A sorting domain-containing protein [Ginsengibacter sp.]